MLKHIGRVYSGCWNNGSLNRICSVCWNNNIYIWDAVSGQCLIMLEEHTRVVHSICWSNNGLNRICSGSNDRTLRILDSESGQCMSTCKGAIWENDKLVGEGHTDNVTCICWSNDGSNRIYSGSLDNTMRIWSPIYPKPI